MPSAKLGADVLGVDIASNLVEAGNKQTQEQGLRNCRFQEGDASALSALENKSFDLVVSMFGAMFAPKPFDVAKEMALLPAPVVLDHRVCPPMATVFPQGISD